MSQRRIAILSDIHGNPIALDNVLADLDERGGADELWILGDVAALGFDPVGVIERLVALPNARFIRGNTDRYVTWNEPGGPKPEAMMQDPAVLERGLSLTRGMGWTTGVLATSGWLPWMEELPLDFRLTLPDGTRLLAVHASPGTDDGSGIKIKMSDDQVRPLIAGAGADWILVGHTHMPFDRQVDGVRLINPGSVSNPFPPDLRAAYLLMTCDEHGCSLEPRRVDYDRQAAISELKRLKHPSLDYITRHLQGQVPQS